MPEMSDSDFFAAGSPAPSVMSDADFMNMGAKQSTPDNSGMTALAGAVKDIGNDSLESLKNTATQTGDAISEPLNNPNANGLMAIPDAAVRTLGKLGNVIGGTGQALFSPVIGSLTASTENSGIIPATASAIKSNLVPDDPRFTSNISPSAQHNIAQDTAGWASSGVGAAMAANQGAANIRTAQGLPPASSPYNPLTDIANTLKQGIPAMADAYAAKYPDGTMPEELPTPKVYSPQEIKAGAVQYYDSSEAKGGMLHADAVDNAIDGAHQAAGYQSQEGKAFAGDNVVTKTLQDLNNLRGSPISLKGAGEIDDEIGDRIGAAFRAGNNDQAAKLMKIRDSLRSAYTNADEDDMVNPNGFADWRTGDKLWSAYRAGDDIQGIIENGEKADVPSTAIKNGFKTFVKNDKNAAGLTDEEWEAANHAAKTGIVTAALKTAGSKIISGVVGGTAGGFGGGIPGALAGAATGEAIGYPFRLAATALQRGRGQNVIDMIGSRPDVRAAMESGPQAATPPAPPAAPLALPAPSIKMPGDQAGLYKALPAPNPADSRFPLVNERNTTNFGQPTMGSVRQMTQQEAENHIAGLQKMSPDITPAERAAQQDMAATAVSNRLQKAAQTYNKDPLASSNGAKYAVDALQSNKADMDAAWNRMSQGDQSKAVDSIINEWDGNEKVLKDAILDSRSRAQSQAAAKGEKYEDSEMTQALLRSLNGYKRGGAVQPTEAQKAAGNYKKDHITLHGLNISIENPKGSIRSGKDKNGKAWECKMPVAYGYIRETLGKDGDHVDCFIGPNPKSLRVYIVDQKNDAGTFDEHKCLIGFKDRESALKAYKDSFSDKKNRIMHVKKMLISDFKEWLKNGNTKKPIREAA